MFGNLDFMVSWKRSRRRDQLGLWTTDELCHFLEDLLHLFLAHSTGLVTMWVTLYISSWWGYINVHLECLLCWHSLGSGNFKDRNLMCKI